MPTLKNPLVKKLAVVLFIKLVVLVALWWGILIANGWMKNPLGSEFSYLTMRMEMTDFTYQVCSWR